MTTVNTGHLRYQMAELAQKSAAIIDQAEADDRPLTPDERGQVEGNLRHINTMRDQLEAANAKAGEVQAADLSRALGTSGEPGPAGAGLAATAGGGWAALAKGIDLKAGKTKATTTLGSLVRTKDLTGPDSEAFAPLRGADVSTPVDARWLYLGLRQQRLGAELSVQEFRQVGSAAVASGDVERDPVATTPKAELDITIESVQEKVRQFAATVSDVPNAIIQAAPTFQAFLSQQMQLKLNDELDAHVLAQLEAYCGGAAATGANLVEEVRNAISVMRANGVQPTLAALSPDDAVDLDLTTVGADGLYLFAVRDSGASSPLFSLQVIEAKRVSNPWLISPDVGVLYLGAAAVQVDPYSGFKSNTSTVRVEFDALMHVRVPDAALEIGGS